MNYMHVYNSIQDQTKMEQTKPYYDPDIINCDDIPDTMPLASTTQHKKVKRPKTKRKRKIAFYNMDNLLITRKLKIKKKKYKYFLNINTVCERSDSIVRSAYNVCKEEAYYQRIVPICLRKMCSSEGDISSCCRSTLSREYKEYHNPKAGSLSPVSSIALTDVIACNNISYEDVSNGSFSSVSDESANELDTLIKRTKQREKQFTHSYQAREYTSTPISKVDYIPTPSPYSIDTDKKSIHSDTTMVLHPHSSEAYSPTASLDAVKIDNYDATSIDIYLPYSPTMTPDLIKLGMDYSPVGRTDDDMSYSPTFTPESIEIDDPTINVPNNINAPNKFSSAFIKIEKLDNTTRTNNNNDHGNELYSPSMIPDMIRMGNPNSYVNRTNVKDENVRYSSSSPSVSPDFHQFTTGQTNIESNPNMANSTVSTMIKRENVDDESTITSNSNCTILTEDLIKKEIFEEYNDQQNSAETDYNMNNTINCKSERNDIQRRHSKVDTNHIVVKIERDEHTNVNLVHSMVLQKNVIVKTE